MSGCAPPYRPLWTRSSGLAAPHVAYRAYAFCGTPACARTVEPPHTLRKHGCGAAPFTVFTRRDTAIVPRRGSCPLSAGGDGQPESFRLTLGELAVLEALRSLGDCLVVCGDSETSRRTLKVLCLLVVADESDVVVFVLDDRQFSLSPRHLLVRFFFNLDSIACWASVSQRSCSRVASHDARVLACRLPLRLSGAPRVVYWFFQVMPMLPARVRATRSATSP